MIRKTATGTDRHTEKVLATIKSTTTSLPGLWCQFQGSASRGDNLEEFAKESTPVCKNVVIVSVIVEAREQSEEAEVKGAEELRGSLSKQRKGNRRKGSNRERHEDACGETR